MKNGDDALLCDSESLKKLGEELSELKAGGLASFAVGGKAYHTIFYNGKDVPVHLCYVLQNSLIVSSSGFISTLASRAERREHQNVKWLCQMKEPGRFAASCVFSGSGRAPRGSGSRDRSSKKSNCTARFSTTFAIRPYIAPSSKKKRISDVFAGLSKRALDLCGSEGVEKTDILRILNCHMSHSGHVQEAVNGAFNSSPVFSSTAILNDEETKAHLLSFLENSTRNTRGNVSRATNYLRAIMPDKEFQEGVVRNALHFLRKTSEDAQELVKYLKASRSEGLIEYLHYEVSEEIGLSYVFFTIKGAKELALRCWEDVCVIDSTHNATKYAYKLISLLYVDSELRSRPSAFGIVLNETPAAYVSFLMDLCHAVGMTLPKTLFSDQDSSISASLTMLPPEATFGGSDVVHITCLWHLLDLNMKKKVGSSIRGGLQNWKHFRSDFIRVRNVRNKDTLPETYCRLLQMWFCDNESCEDNSSCNLHGLSIEEYETRPYEATRMGKAIRYMVDNVWACKEKWAFCFFPDIRTLGMQTTQRVESWHSIFKGISVEHMSLKSIFQRLICKARDLGTFENSKNAVMGSERILKRLPFISTEELSVLRNRNGVLSREAATILEGEFSSSTKIKARGFVFELTKAGETHSEELCSLRIFAECISPSPSTEGHKNISIIGEKPKREVSIELLVPKEQSEYQVEHISAESISCTCSFWDKMGLPCRHIISVAYTLQVLSSSSDGIFEAKLKEGKSIETSSVHSICMTNVSIIESILGLTVRFGGRWMLPARSEEEFVQGVSEGLGIPAMASLENFVERERAFKGPLEFGNQVGRSDTDPVTGLFRRASFPISKSGESDIQGYAIISSLGKILAERCTGSYRNRFFGGLWCRIMSQFIHDFDAISEVSDVEAVRLSDHILRKALESALHDTENSTAPVIFQRGEEAFYVATEAEDQFDTSEKKEIQNLRAMRKIEQESKQKKWEEKMSMTNTRDIQTNSFAFIRKEGNSNGKKWNIRESTFSINSPDSRRDSPRPPVSVENEVESSEKHSLESSSATFGLPHIPPIIMTPPTRAAQKGPGADPNSKMKQYRGLQERYKRKLKSRSTPCRPSVLCGAPENVNPGLKVFGCPYCNKLKPQKCDANVRQHILFKHKGFHLPKESEMRAAAEALGLERKKDGILNSTKAEGGNEDALEKEHQKAERKRLLNRLDEQEFSIIGEVFRKYYPPPPSNGMVEGRYQLQHGLRSMPKELLNSIWDNKLREWSSRWWELQGRFFEECRKRKRRKTRKDPTLQHDEVENWGEQFLIREGPAKVDEPDAGSELESGDNKNREESDISRSASPVDMEQIAHPALVQVPIDVQARVGKIALVPSREEIPNVFCLNSVKVRGRVSPNTSRNNDARDVSIGCVVEILWKQELRWFRGKISEVSKGCSTQDSVSFTIAYEDGDTECIEDLTQERWRKVFCTSTPLPACPVQNNAVTEGIFRDLMEKAGKSETKVETKSKLRMYPSDILSLQPTCWLSDAIIDSFAKFLIRNSVHRSDKRFSIIDPTATVLATSNDPSRKEELSRWLDPLELHDVDTLVWPIHASGNHWCLCIADTGTREVYIFDPFYPGLKSPKLPSLGRAIVEGLETMCKPYKTKYSDKEEWRLCSTVQLARKMNLWRQPSNNGSDCGVLVCLYMWAFFTGEPMPPLQVSNSRRQNNDSFNSFMVAARKNIAALI